MENGRVGGKEGVFDGEWEVSAMVLWEVWERGWDGPKGFEGDDGRG